MYFPDSVNLLFVHRNNVYQWHKTARIWHSAGNMTADNRVFGMIKILLIAPNNPRYAEPGVAMVACINFDLRWDAHRKCVPLFVNARCNQDREHFNNARPVNQFPIRHRAWHAAMCEARDPIATSDGVWLRGFTFGTSAAITIKFFRQRTDGKQSFETHKFRINIMRKKRDYRLIITIK